RSNVGKSSLINCLLGRKRIARVSKRPGKTQEINFYEVDGRFYLVDLPGYGFAEAPPEVQQRWGPLIEAYLAGAPDLLGVLVLVDARHGPTGDDEQLLEFVARLGIPALFVLTKIDKLSRSKRKKAVRRAREALEAPEDQVVVTSAVTGEGRETLLASMEALLEGAEEAGRTRGGGDSDAVRPV
ncbi:MAG TPA: ribosome biogenesis GTP-binding protein YihA/YsxC, partial [Longimicrobiales bacterium]|nr:ribosome biogenesis GTP-binding protein YihA/YsxC [Longimicrobiales bacterium]